MNYELGELVPIVARLAEGYTSKASTSITYDRAQQLMRAVLYCIQEGENSGQFTLMTGTELSAEKMYEIGAGCVQEKTKETLNLYNGMMTLFSSYGNRCLQDTVEKGLPEFFKWYDCRFEPQNTILTLDYPVLTDLSEESGIDKIHDYVVCIQMEQKFLNRLPSEYVVESLLQYNKRYKLLIENLCEIVLTNLIGHILTGQKISGMPLQQEEYSRLQETIQEESLSQLRKRITDAIHRLILEYYENDGELEAYLQRAVENISTRIKCAADNGNLCCIFR